MIPYSENNPVHFVLLHASDNVIVCCRDASENQIVTIADKNIVLRAAIHVGHKVALFDIAKGQKIIKYGVSIGSATRDIQVGDHVHMNNVKSDYIPSHTRDGHSRTGQNQSQNQQSEGEQS